MPAHGDADHFNCICEFSVRCAVFRNQQAGCNVAEAHARLGSCCSTQVGFFNIVGMPLFQAIADVFPDMKPLLATLVGNYRMWEQLQRKEGSHRPSLDATQTKPEPA